MKCNTKIHAYVQKNFDELRITQDWNEMVKCDHKIVKEIRDVITRPKSEMDYELMTPIGYFHAEGHNSLIEFIKKVRHLLCIPSIVSMLFGLTVQICML